MRSFGPLAALAAFVVIGLCVLNESRANGYLCAPQASCPGGVCPTGNCPTCPTPQAAAYNAAAPIAYAPSHRDLVDIHNELHNGFPNGPDWTWPGDLADHLRTVHGVDVPVSTSAQAGAVVYAGGGCPTCPNGGLSGSVQFAASAPTTTRVVYRARFGARRPVAAAVARGAVRAPFRVMRGGARVVGRVLFGRRRGCGG